jgi:hypothetical protein
MARPMDFFNLPNPYIRTRPWGFTQCARELGSRDRNKKIFFESTARPVCDADNLTTVWTIRDLLHLTTL